MLEAHQGMSSRHARFLGAKRILAARHATLQLCCSLACLFLDGNDSPEAREIFGFLKADSFPFSISYDHKLHGSGQTPAVSDHADLG